jgi:hypothetical protein
VPPAAFPSEGDTLSAELHPVEVWVPEWAFDTPFDGRRQTPQSSILKALPQQPNRGLANA